MSEPDGLTDAERDLACICDWPHPGPHSPQCVARTASVARIKADAYQQGRAETERLAAIAVAREHLRMVEKVEEARQEAHECLTAPLCDGWPFAVDDAYRTIAAVAWPGERKENRDGWAVTMRHRPDLFEQEAARARERLEAAIAHGRSATLAADATPTDAADEMMKS